MACKEQELQARKDTWLTSQAAAGWYFFIELALQGAAETVKAALQGVVSFILSQHVSE